MAVIKVAIPLDGFYEDCKELISRCTNNRKVNYRDFTRVWQAMQFGRIFEDFSSGARITDEEDYRELINVAKRLMTISTANYEESVAAMFIVHGLLNLPPFADEITLRLDQADDRCLDRIELVATKDFRSDILYILGAVLIKSIEVPLRSKVVIVNRRKGLEDRRRLLVNYIRDMGTKTKIEYSKMTQSIVGSGYKDPFLGFCDEAFSAHLTAAFQKMFISPGDDEDGPSASFHDKAVGAKRALEIEPTASTSSDSKYATELDDTSEPSCSGTKKGKVIVNKSAQTSKKRKGCHQCNCCCSDHEHSNSTDGPDEADEEKTDPELEVLAKEEPKTEVQDKARPSISVEARSSPAVARVIPTMAEMFRPQQEHEKEEMKRIILKSRRSRMGIVSLPLD